VALARYTPDGALDETFGEGGFVLSDVTGKRETGTSLAIDSTGRIVIAGYTDVGYYSVEYNFLLTRFLPDGSLDLAFGAGGGVISEAGYNDELYALTLQDDNTIVVAGKSGYYGFSDYFTVARYREETPTVTPTATPGPPPPTATPTATAIVPPGGMTLWLPLAR
jgi:uncharacterized delta-60 repeat protein